MLLLSHKVPTDLLTALLLLADLVDLTHKRESAEGNMSLVLQAVHLDILDMV